VPSSGRKFQGLLTDAPKPLPDDEEARAPAESPVSSGRPEPAAERAGGPRSPAASRSEPAHTEREAPAPPPLGELAGEGRAALTIRLHEPAAVALNSAWLYQRMHVNPKLSYPEFASEIVRLGLAAFERQAEPQARGRRRAGR
jgi:hypothetical protein